ncbi:MAG: pentalenene synthase, partial [Desulfuromonadales bacterium]|nr:pentalenene synthase [Desulfuromonadales bacterium]
HLLGLGHCEDELCAMFFSTTLEESDRKGPELCSRCQGKMPTLS